jgi:hypothetical protein
VTIPNEPAQIGKLLGRLKNEGVVRRACYEAGSCRYEVYRQLASRRGSCPQPLRVRSSGPGGTYIGTFLDSTCSAGQAWSDANYNCPLADIDGIAVAVRACPQ